MASQVLSGVGNFSYTNNTGKNVRIFINWMSGMSTVSASVSQGVISSSIVLTWNGVKSPPTAINAINSHATVLNGVENVNGSPGTVPGYLNTYLGLPNEIMLAPGQSFSSECGTYNVVIIPEEVPNGSLASQVLSGSSNPSYTNNTGRNVRLIINYMCCPYSSITRTIGSQTSGPYADTPILLNWAGISHRCNSQYLAKYFKYTPLSISGQSPIEIMLAPGQSFSASCGVYNIVVIPE